MVILVITAIVVFMALVMEIAAIGLKLTGMNIDRARFQALSALTGTGFTTRESEIIVHHRVRRRIVMALMIIGHIGLAAILISVVNIRLPIIWWQILVAVVVVLLLLRIASDKFLLTWLDRVIETGLPKMEHKPLSEILTVDDTYGVAEIEIDGNHVLTGKTLARSRLREREILVLAIRRGRSTIPPPELMTRSLKEMCWSFTATWKT
jgi:hypothetical protein